LSLLIAHIYVLVKMKVDDVDGAYNCPICQQTSVKEVIGCDRCMEWFHLQCLGIQEELPNAKTWFCCNLQEMK
jgi:hypothetical protein